MNAISTNFRPIQCRNFIINHEVVKQCRFQSAGRGLVCSVGLARLIQISVNLSIYNRITITDMKIQKSIIFNRCFVR